ncbi:putative lipoprotein [Myxococcus hansupus]|uniref:Putative lipoprotein n=1 Tax=Pseudomyxococcus hansupus TaxID=1297742 RepID=A0A0H4X2V0_9BACT|nr:putative metal-binding motif-containing protein [Myxococcus hansupus]AKQ69971.1 putative lipoprotein [Myxococcus hansupus]
MIRWSVALLALMLTACSVPSLEELQGDRPRACNAQRGCGAGQVCLFGACQDSPCGTRTPTTAYVDADGDGYAADDAASRVFCDAVPPGYATNRGDCDDSNAQVYPGALELCNGRDDNCDGQMEQGSVTRTWYLDQDRDGFGRNGPGVEACDPPSERHVNVSGDCDDEWAAVHPNAQELCNGLDDNCDGTVDESFPEVGMACTAACGGRFMCNATQDGTVCEGTPRTQYFADVDGDGEGDRNGAPLGEGCPGETPPAGMVANSLDCDDNDDGTSSQRMEICDGLDNNCDGRVDEGMSCGQLRRVVDPALTGRQWRAVAVHPDGYPVWVAGMDGKLAVKMSATSAFVSHDSGLATGCSHQGNSPDWHAVWVHPGNAYAVVAGEDGWIAEHNMGFCSSPLKYDLPGDNDYFSGVVGVGSPLRVFAASTLGHLYEGSGPVLRHNSDGRYWGLHAAGQDMLYAVGSAGEGAPFSPVINQFHQSNWSNPTTQILQGVSGYNGSLRAVWAVSPLLVFAVGDAGLVMAGSALSPNWERILPPRGGAPDFVSVSVPSGPISAYILGNGGSGQRLYRLTQHGWAKAPTFAQGNPTVSLRSLAMTSAGNFWIVGDDGHVYHFPEGATQ